jgi:hypothetical protein
MQSETGNNPAEFENRADLYNNALIEDLRGNEEVKLKIIEIIC